MKTDLRSKFLDGVVSALIIMALMWPLILMFRLLPKWGAAGYWGAAVIVLMAGTWMLHRTTLKNRSEVGRVWYGTAGGLLDRFRDQPRNRSDRYRRRQHRTRSGAIRPVSGCAVEILPHRC